MKAQKLMTPLAFVALMGSLSLPANAALITADLIDEDNGFEGTVTIEDTTNETDLNSNLGRLSFVLDVATPNTGLTSGDILGIWLDVDESKESLLPSLASAFALSPNTLFQNALQYNISFSGGAATYSPVNYSIAQSVFSEDGVGDKPFSGHNNIGIGGRPGGDYDIGIRVGASGNSEGKNPKVSFDMVFAGLSLDWFSGQSIALRVQSITIPGIINDGSAKLTGNFNDDDREDENLVPVPSTLLLLGIGMLAMRRFFA